MSRAVLILYAVFIALAITPAASADKPTREILPGPEDFVVTDQCDFPVLIHTKGDGILTTFTDGEGNVVRQSFIFPGNKQVFTNLATGRSIEVVTVGPGFLKFNPDGSGSFKVVGPSGWLAHPVTGEPGIFLTKGRFLLTFDSEGNELSVSLSGPAVDLCAKLAA